MTDERPGKPAGKKTTQTDSERDRAARQAAALRENLRKRNAQRRERQATAPDSGPDGDDA